MYVTSTLHILYFYAVYIPRIRCEYVTNVLLICNERICFKYAACAPRIRRKYVAYILHEYEEIAN